jgi:hypothetical protein
VEQLPVSQVVPKVGYAVPGSVPRQEATSGVLFQTSLLEDQPGFCASGSSCDLVSIPLPGLKAFLTRVGKILELFSPGFLEASG